MSVHCVPRSSSRTDEGLQIYVRLCTLIEFRCACASGDTVMIRECVRGRGNRDFLMAASGMQTQHVRRELATV